MKNFELFSKFIDGKEKWYFYYNKGNKKCIKNCLNCKTKEDAILLLQNFKKRILKENQYLIKNIASEMFLMESEHLHRLQNFGKDLSLKTIHQKRQIIELIINEFGEYKINELQIKKIENYLLKDNLHSGSWKNFYLETFGSIYEETIWKCETPVSKPQFQKFARNSKKPDIFTVDELNKIFKKSNWDSKTEWLLFFITAYCGLRLGEARALQVRQIKISEGILVIDGFLKYNGLRTIYNKKGNSTDRKIRCVPIPNIVLNEIILFLNKNKLQDSDYLFLDENGRTYTNSHLEHTFKKVLKLSGIKLSGKRLIPHSLRFTYVTRMRTKLDAEIVQKLVGHSSVEMTEYYTRTAIPEMVEAVKPALEAANKLFE